MTEPTTPAAHTKPEAQASGSEKGYHHKKQSLSVEDHSLALFDVAHLSWSFLFYLTKQVKIENTKRCNTSPTRKRGIGKSSEIFPRLRVGLVFLRVGLVFLRFGLGVSRRCCWLSHFNSANSPER